MIRFLSQNKENIRKKRSKRKIKNKRNRKSRENYKNKKGMQEREVILQEVQQIRDHDHAIGEDIDSRID